MTNDIKVNQLTAQQVYEILDRSEGKGKVNDGRLEAQSWNSLMDIFGLQKKKIKNSIQGNTYTDSNGKHWGAIDSIKSYLKKADNNTKQQVANYLNGLGVELNSSNNTNASAKTQTVSATKQPQKTQVQTPTVPKSTLENYNNNMSDAAKALKPDLIQTEGKVCATSIEPDGKSTIGYGHKLQFKPAFLSAIDGATKKVKTEDGKLVTVSETVQWKKSQLAAALENPVNKVALKSCLEAELAAAAQNTGINNVPLTISANLQLTDAQMELLLNSDIKKAETQMEKEVGTTVLKKRTTNQKTAVLDMYYNMGSLKKKAPKFLKYFKEGDMTKAVAELNINKIGGKHARGLHRRNYERARLLFKDGKLPKEAQKAILDEYNKYLAEQNKPALTTFEKAVQAMYA